MSANIQFRLSKNDSGTQTLVAFADGQLTDPIDDTHPNFKAIVAACVGDDPVDTQAFLDLFDIAKAVERKFEKLGERVSVRGNQILFDGDPVEGPLEDQILGFLEEGKDFAPLVKFYEALSTNPLGNVREGLFSWIKGQKAEGNFTIDQDGNVLGYKAVAPQSPEWRTEHETVYVPSRRSNAADIVNGVEVEPGQFIEQVPGDVVEMPRSRVLNAPSQACGDGLHIGTYNYAKRFMSGYGTVMLVKFSPRDIVSLPDSNSEWKLRVNRYTVIGPVDEPLETVFLDTSVDTDETPDVSLSIDEPEFDDVSDFDEIEVGDLITDDDGDNGVVTSIEPDEDGYTEDDILRIDYSTNEQEGGITSSGYPLSRQSVVKATRKRTYSGRTSQAAKGNGRNPAQDAVARFSSGRPGSARDNSTGRFV